LWFTYLVLLLLLQFNASPDNDPPPQRYTHGLATEPSGIEYVHDSRSNISLTLRYFAVGGLLLIYQDTHIHTLALTLPLIDARTMVKKSTVCKLVLSDAIHTNGSTIEPLIIIVPIDRDLSLQNLYCYPACYLVYLSTTHIASSHPILPCALTCLVEAFLIGIKVDSLYLQLRRSWLFIRETDSPLQAYICRTSRRTSFSTWFLTRNRRRS